MTIESVITKWEARTSLDLRTFSRELIEALEQIYEECDGDAEYMFITATRTLSSKGDTK